jgi:hypothetical protein
VLRPVDIFLLEHYNGGRVLIDSFNDTHNFATLGIDLGDVIYEGNNTVWRSALTYPERYAQWVIVGPHDLIAQSINLHGHRFLSLSILVAKDSHGSRIYYQRNAPPLPTRAASSSLLHGHAACHTGLPTNPEPTGGQPNAPPASPHQQGPHASLAPPLAAQASAWTRPGLTALFGEARL